MKPTTPPKDTAETWEEKLEDEVYIPHDENCDLNLEFSENCDCGVPDCYKNIKAFIRSELAHLLEEVDENFDESYVKSEGLFTLHEDFVERLTQLRKKYLGD